MSLPARERRKLAAIERAEAWTDPGLAARFSISTSSAGTRTCRAPNG